MTDPSPLYGDAKRPCRTAGVLPGIYTVLMFCVGASVVSLAPTFLQEPERTLPADPPLWWHICRHMN